MAVAVACPECRIQLQVPENLSGRPVKCPKCQKVFAASTAPAAPAKVAVTTAPAIAKGKGVAPPPKRAPMRVEEVCAVGEADVIETTGVETISVGETDVVETTHEDVVSVGESDVRDWIEPPPVKSFDELGVPAGLQEDIRNSLAKDEQIIWAGAMSPRLMPNYLWFIAIPFGVVFAFIGFTMTASVTAMLAQQKDIPIIVPIMVALIGGTFGLFGVGCCFFPLILKKFKGVRQYYVLTNQRALICKKLIGPASIRAFTGRHLKRMKTVLHARFREAGSLVFSSEHLGYHDTGHAMNQDVGFLHVEDVKLVEQLVRQTLIDPIA